jgi:hypothetical protein
MDAEYVKPSRARVRTTSVYITSTKMPGITGMKLELLTSCVIETFAEA